MPRPIALPPKPCVTRTSDVPLRGAFGFGQILAKVGEPAGIRTRDLLIKSQLLYRLSYALRRRGGKPGLTRGQ